MPTSNSPISLKDFTEATRNGGSGRWCDTLPKELKEEIIASNAGSKVVSDWLKTVHNLDDATPKKVEPLIDERRRRASE